MRKQKSGGQLGLLAHQETAQNGALLAAATPKTAPCSPSDPSKSALARSDEGLSKALLTGSGARARGISESPRPDFGGVEREQGPFLGGGSASKEPKAVNATALVQYLSGPSCSHGSVKLIQPKFFPEDASWLAKRIVDLAEQRTKAEAYLDRITPTWEDPVPAEAEQITRWKRYFKTQAIVWEFWILKEYAGIGQACPRGGFKGMRCYTFASPALLQAFMAEVANQTKIGAPLTWHGHNLVQLAEADFVAVVD